MLLFRTEASTKIGFRRLERSVYLFSLLRKECEALFCVNRDKTAEKFLQEKKIPFCPLKKLLKLEQPVKTIFFDLGNFGPEDKELLLREGRDTVQILDPGDTEEKSCTFRINVPAFTVLHNKFRHFNTVKRKYRKKLRNIFLDLEGAVEYRELKKIVDLLCRGQYNLKIAPGFFLKKAHRKTLKRIYPRIRLVGETDSLARSFFEADAALVTPGPAAYGAAAAGTPALYFPGSKEQAGAAAIYAGQGIGFAVPGIEALPEKLGLLTFERRLEMGAAGKKLVDGKGVYRVISFLRQICVPI